MQKRRKRKRKYNMFQRIMRFLVFSIRDAWRGWKSIHFALEQWIEFIQISIVGVLVLVILTGMVKFLAPAELFEDMEHTPSISECY